jgi:hypothetical protein
VTNPEKRERAALDVLNRLPDRWALGPTSYDSGTGRWTYSARGPHPGRGKYPETITGTGVDELAAMTDVRIRLDERRRVRSSPTSTGAAVRLSSKEPRSGLLRSRAGR